jgi:hypothetical protein
MKMNFITEDPKLALQVQNTGSLVTGVSIEKDPNQCSRVVVTVDSHMYKATPLMHHFCTIDDGGPITEFHFGINTLGMTTFGVKLSMKNNPYNPIFVQPGRGDFWSSNGDVAMSYTHIPQTDIVVIPSEGWRMMGHMTIQALNLLLDDIGYAMYFGKENTLEYPDRWYPAPKLKLELQLEV